MNFFEKNSCAKAVINIGCCYQLIQEQFESPIGNQSKTRQLNNRYGNCDSDPMHPNSNRVTQYGFALSDVLKKRKYCLGKNGSDPCKINDQSMLEKR